MEYDLNLIIFLVVRQMVAVEFKYLYGMLNHIMVGDQEKHSKSRYGDLPNFQCSRNNLISSVRVSLIKNKFQIQPPER